MYGSVLPFPLSIRQPERDGLGVPVHGMQERVSRQYRTEYGTLLPQEFMRRKGAMVILMKLLDDIKNFFLPPEDEGYDEGETVREKPVRREREYDHDRDRDREHSRDRGRDYDEDPEEKRNKVVNISATAQLQVVLVKPEVFTDAKQIADHLIAKKTVVLNLETASAENKRRIIDCLVGVAYANGGSLKPVANLT